MRKALAILGVAVVVVYLGSLAAVAQESSSPHVPRVKPGEVYEKTTIWKGVQDKAPVPLPHPVETAPAPGGESTMAARQGGPVATGRPSTGGSAIPGMSGGNILSSKQRADQEIKRLIRRLG